MSCEASKASLELSAFAGPSSMLVLPYWRHDEEELSKDLRSQDFSAAISSRWEAVLHPTVVKSSLLFAAEVLQQRAKHRPPSTRRSQRPWLNQFQTCFYFEISNVFHGPSSIKKALATSFFLAASTLTLNMFFSYTVSYSVSVQVFLWSYYDVFLMMPHVKSQGHTMDLKQILRAGLQLCTKAGLGLAAGSGLSEPVVKLVPGKRTRGDSFAENRSMSWTLRIEPSCTRKKLQGRQVGRKSQTSESRVCPCLHEMYYRNVKSW